MRVVAYYRIPKRSADKVPTLTDFEPAVYLEGAWYWILTYRIFRWLWGHAMSVQDWAESKCKVIRVPGESPNA